MDKGAENAEDRVSTSLNEALHNAREAVRLMEEALEQHRRQRAGQGQPPHDASGSGGDVAQTIAQLLTNGDAAVSTETERQSNG